MRVAIKRTAPLIAPRARVEAGSLRKAAGLALLAATAAAVALCIWLWAVELDAAPPPPLEGLAARWHVWLVIALASGAAGAAALRSPQRPT